MENDVSNLVVPPPGDESPLAVNPGSVPDSRPAEPPRALPAIAVNGLTKRYGSVLALNNLTFEIPPGVIAGFVGPNGAGKTTTIRILATLLKPDRGEARVFGYRANDPAEAEQVRHSIGFMPDYFGLYNDMTASEYLDFFAAAYRIPAPARPALIDDILALVSLMEKKDTIIQGLSRGMQQKLSLGRALIHSPSLLLLDEPASGLDPRARIELMELLRELKKMGKTILISSHILSELHHLCDMVVIIEKGQLVYTGSLEAASDGISAGKRFLEVTVCGDPDPVASLLGGLKGVHAVRRKEQVLILDHSLDLSSAEIIEACVKAGYRIEEARKVSASLEEVFMRMTGNGAPPPPIPGAQ